MDRAVTLERHNLTVTVKELTVADVRDWLRSLQDLQEFDAVNAALFQEEGASIDDVLRMTDLDKAELDQLPPADVVKVIDKCKQVNPHFFRFRAAMIEIGSPSQPTDTPSAPSSEPPVRP
ncbi:hypothetical protein [Marinobacter pelagius]|uniref:Uncharacterized protein n=1 Tax=Marinobacter pelagius TaxID=379482 RepID=A0A1I4T3W9_9GAMM|nr:hypothetical protein [Marinobacter pelagius]SFM71313.1 hypothetical protein SAMN04487961_0983 [Marinobacter pelagius]